MDMRKLIVLALIMQAFTFGAAAQQAVSGTVVNAAGSGIDAVAVVLNTADSAYVDAQVTDSTGLFRFPSVPAGAYVLLFQHVAYKMSERPLKVDASPVELGTLPLTEKTFGMGEVEVKAERPLVVLHEGRLTYNVPVLTAGKAITTAFDALKEVPGVMSDGDRLSLVGARGLNILINGQVTGMTYDQLVMVLKSLPASRVQNVEVVYSAPPQYNIRGAMLNVQIGEETTPVNALQGEVTAEYVQRHYAGENVRGNLLYTSPHLTADFLYNFSSGKNYKNEDITSWHTLDGKVTEITEHNTGNARRNAHLMRTGLTYLFDNKDKLTASYTLSIDDNDADRFAHVRIGEEPFESSNLTDGHNAFHNVKAEYKSHADLVAGLDYTHYKDPTNQHYTGIRAAGLPDEEYRTHSRQRIDKVVAYANKTHSFAGRWTLNYGTNLSYSTSQNEYLYYKKTASGFDYTPDNSSFYNQKEYTANGFAGFTCTVNDKFSAEAALALEYYRSTHEAGGRTETVWNECALFPTVNLTYMFAPSHILQASLASDKSYPSYWDMNPVTWQLNSYSCIEGNPALKPSRSYEATLNYIFRQKYVLVAYFMQSPNYIAQLAYQSADELKTVFRTVNMDYLQQYGLSLILPFRIGEVLDSRLTLNGFRMREKDRNFYDVPYDRSRYSFQTVLNNTFTLSRKPDLRLELSGYYTHPAIQGIYDLGRTYDLTSGLKWTFAREKAILMVRCEDILNSRTPDIEMNYANQHNRMKVFGDTRRFTVSFVYKFGGFKEENKETVDKARFGRNGI